MSIEAEMYRSGRLDEATMALMLPVMSVESQANAVYRCAKESRETIACETIRQDIERLERAAATLRSVIDLAKPALRLVAAE